jgi:hypothetical protein
VRSRAFYFVSVLCLLAISAPSWAKYLSSKFEFAHLTKIAGTNLKPGTYRFVANVSTGETNVLRNGKVVVHVKGQWVDLKEKSTYNEVLSTGHDIQEVRFAGRNRTLKFGS